MDERQWQRWFEGIWTDREERIYRAFFGDTGKAIFNIPLATFRSLGKPDPDRRFLTHGVLECPPSGQRRDWVYVSSGMSNPWGENPETVDTNAYSGLGFEFVMHTREQAAWAVPVLHYLMAVQLMVACGELQGHLLERNDRIPLGGALWKKEGAISHLLVAAPPPPPQGYPATFQLASGKVDLMLVIGMSQRESDFAKTQGTDPLLDVLRHRGIFPRTEPERLSMI